MQRLRLDVIVKYFVDQVKSETGLMNILMTQMIFTVRGSATGFVIELDDALTSDAGVAMTVESPMDAEMKVEAARVEDPLRTGMGSPASKALHQEAPPTTTTFQCGLPYDEVLGKGFGVDGLGEEWRQSLDLMDLEENFGEDRDEYLLSSLAKVTYHLRRARDESHQTFFNKWDTVSFPSTKASCWSTACASPSLRSRADSTTPEVRKRETKLQVNQVVKLIRRSTPWRKPRPEEDHVRPEHQGQECKRAVTWV